MDLLIFLGTELLLNVLLLFLTLIHDKLLIRNLLGLFFYLQGSLLAQEWLSGLVQDLKVCLFSYINDLIVDGGDVNFLVILFDLDLVKRGSIEVVNSERASTTNRSMIHCFRRSLGRSMCVGASITDSARERRHVRLLS